MKLLLNSQEIRYKEISDADLSIRLCHSPLGLLEAHLVTTDHGSFLLHLSCPPLLLQQLALLITTTRTNTALQHQ